ncbi:MAG: cytochrome bc complex cytochrome b subunit [Acidobacteriia bacterium]|nr:cytochrome bc complex cytochrome b subunit [Terriglobia bacterium]
MSQENKIGSKFYRWIDERVQLANLRKFMAKKAVPQHRHSLWYYFGGMTLFLFLVQVGTGILLTLYYRPSAEEAYESVQFIMTEVKFGWLIRSIHSWSANLLIAAMFIHLFSVYFLKSYRRPRELTWLSGMFLFVLVLAFGFSGYLLPWNELSFFATKVGTEIAGVLPVVGKFTLHLLRGGDDVTGATLSRFYGFHIAILPGIATMILTIHLLLVQRLGMSVPRGVEKELERTKKPLKEVPFFPNFLLHDLLGWYVALAALAALAALMPWELGKKADPFSSAPAGIRPEWYFVYMFQTLKFIPAKILGMDGEVLGIFGFGLGGLFLFLVPFLDREPLAGRRTALFTGIGVFIVVYILTLTFVGYRV